MGKISLSGGGERAIHSDKMAVSRLFLTRGEARGEDEHPEEQIVYVESGRLEVTLGSGDELETYLVDRGQASFHGPDIPYLLRAVEDTWALSFKNIPRPTHH